MSCSSSSMEVLVLVRYSMIFSSHPLLFSLSMYVSEKMETEPMTAILPPFPFRLKATKREVL